MGSGQSFGKFSPPTGGYLYNMQTVYSLWSEETLSYCDV